MKKKKKPLTVEEVATKDIKKELKREGKTFFTYVTELNPVMDKLVDDYLENQSNVEYER